MTNPNDMTDDVGPAGDALPEDAPESAASTSAAADAEAIPDADGGFAALGLSAPIVQALVQLGYEEPTPIQSAAIPPLLEGRDVLGQAATGTGKTAAFALPMLQRIASARAERGDGDTVTSALVLVPTRELAMQVAEAVHKYGRHIGTSVLPVYGGAAMDRQLRALKRGVDVVVATPGRALDHIRRRTLRLEHVRSVVLDEADEMLDMGFAEDLDAILEALPAERQTALFSATLPPRISSIAERHLKDPVRLAIARESVMAGEMPKVRQTAYIVARPYKPAALGRVLDVERPSAALVFCRTRGEVDELTETLNGRGYRSEALHGGMSQEQRERVMRRFRSGAAELLIATDVAARGLDIEHLSHVVNYDVPSSSEAYVHRIGRVGRAGRAGVAITLAEPREHRYLRNIEYQTKQKIDVSTLPTVADLRARRIELTRASLEEVLVDGDLEHFRVIVETLAAEYDPMDVAAAAVKLAHQESAGADGDEEEIPVPVSREGRGRERDRDRPGRSRGFEGEGRGDRFARGDRGGREDRGPREDRGERGERGDRPGRKPRRERQQPEWEVTRIYIGAGRRMGVRPGDLVGAITNEVGVEGSAVGAIEIADRFSLVEVPEEIAEDIIGALRSTTIKGKRVPVRRDRGPA